MELVKTLATMAISHDFNQRSTYVGIHFTTDITIGSCKYTIDLYDPGPGDFDMWSGKFILNSDDICMLITGNDRSGRTIIVPNEYRIPNNIEDIRLVYAYIVYYAHFKDFEIESAPDWVKVGLYNKDLLPWEQERIRWEKVEETAYKCVVERGYGRAFRGQIYFLIGEAYEEYRWNNRNNLLLPALDGNRRKLKTWLLKDDAKNRTKLKELIGTHFIKFAMHDKVLEATVTIGSVSYSTRTLATASVKWDKYFLVDAFDFLSITPDIKDNLTLKFLDKELTKEYTTFYINNARFDCTYHDALSAV